MREFDRTILHVDMDAFYASIEINDHPHLAGLPVVVGGGGARGVVAAASYAARQFGVHSAMATQQALRLCRDLIIIPPRPERYQEVSNTIFGIFENYTPDIEGLSLDEAFLELTHCRRMWPDPVATAQQIKQAIVDRTGLTASIGVSVNKLLAKLASDWRKPDGLFVIKRSEAEALLAPLPIERLYGIGPKTVPRLKALHIHTFSDLAKANANQLRPILGSATETMLARARGIDDRLVESARDGKQLGAERTFATDIFDRREVRTELLKLVDQVSHRLRQEKLFSRRLSLKIRRADFKTYSRSRTFDTPSQSRRWLADQALMLWQLFDEEQPQAAIRLLGVAAAELTSESQSDLFEHVRDPAATRANTAAVTTGSGATDLTDTLDEIQRRFGADALKRGSGIKPSR
jgi:DNA polymerase IV